MSAERKIKIFFAATGVLGFVLVAVGIGVCIHHSRLLLASLLGLGGALFLKAYLELLIPRHEASEKKRESLSPESDLKTIQDINIRVEELAERTELLLRHFPRVKTKKRESVQLNTIASSVSSGILESAYLIQRIVRLIDDKRKWITKTQSEEVAEIVTDLEKQVECLSSAALRLQLGFEKTTVVAESPPTKARSVPSRPRSTRRRNG